MYFLRAERKVLELFGRINRPNKKVWMREVDDALEELKATGKSWLLTKRWREQEVDYELSDDWLAKLNEYAVTCRVKLRSVCAGHPHGVSGLGLAATSPQFTMLCESHEMAVSLASYLDLPSTKITVNKHKNDIGYWLHVSSTIRHTGKNQEHLASWWSDVLIAFRKATRLAKQCKLSTFRPRT